MSATEPTTRQAGEVLLTRKAAAEMLDTTVRTLDRWDRLGIGPPRVKVGSAGQGLVRYRRESIMAWLIEHEHSGPPPSPPPRKLGRRRR
jgi:phage terminase Nu1 subunit (DNA packaging protein)